MNWIFDPAEACAASEPNTRPRYPTTHFEGVCKYGGLTDANGRGRRLRMHAERRRKARAKLARQSQRGGR